MNSYLESVLTTVVAKNPGEPEFHQAVEEVVQSLGPVLDRHPEYREQRILERMVEPERVIVFRVPWVDDRGEIRINRGSAADVAHLHLRQPVGAVSPKLRVPILSPAPDRSDRVL
jgi:hypothetical protein